MKRKVLVYMFIFIISSIASLFLFEVYASLNPNLFPGYGHMSNNNIDDKIDKCSNTENILAIYGDSFTEWYGDNEENISKLLEKKYLNYEVCNFGMSGTSIANYINRFQNTLNSNLNLKKAIFYLYEGNDFFEFRYHKKNSRIEDISIKNKNIFDYSDINSSERKNNLIKNFIKSTKALNIIWREFIKKFFLKNSIDENYVRQIYNTNTYFEVSLSDAIQRMNDTPENIKKDFSSGILNENFYKLALRNPDYFNQIFNPGEYEFEIQKNVAQKHINHINERCSTYKIECVFIIIPNDEFLFQESKDKYSNIFMFNKNINFGRSKIVNFLENFYDNVYYPINLFNYEDFIPFDMHMLPSGNRKLANFTHEIFK